jgi:formate-dependent nitrite reductase cytochrome c552 subunit
MKTAKLTWALAFAAAAAFAAAPLSAADDACTRCHGDPALVVKSKKLHDYFHDWEGSVHDEAGLSCADCHGGNTDGATKEAAHEGILPPSDKNSRLHYREVPETCGNCHKPVYKYFVKSRHYRKLREKGTAPNCVTCHGSMNSKTDEREILASSCAECHNETSKNRPEIVAQADKIIERLRYAEGYRKWAKFYYKSVGKSEKLEKIDPLYNDILDGWHSFDFRQLDWDSKKLLAEVKALFESLSRERKKAGGDED